MAKQDIRDAQLGDEFEVQGSVEQWNLHAEASRRAMSASNDPRRQRTSQSRPTIDVYNTTGDDLAPLSIVGFGEAIYPPDPVGSVANPMPLPFAIGTALEAVAPIAGNFGVLIAATPADAWGKAIIQGDVAVQIYVESEEQLALNFADADPEDASGLLMASSGPAQILWIDTPEEYPGTVWAYVKLGGGGGRAGYIEFSLIHTLLVGDEAASIAVTLSVNGPAVGTEMGATNPFGMFSGDGYLAVNSAYDVGRRGMAVDWGDGVYRIIQMECE